MLDDAQRATLIQTCRYGTFSYTLVLDNDLRLHTQVNKHTLKWFKAAKADRFAIHSVVFQFMCVDMDCLFDKPADQRPPLKLMKLFQIEGREMVAIVDDDDDDESQRQRSKRHEARAEKAKIEVDQLAERGLRLEDAARASAVVVSFGRLRLFQYACKSLLGMVALIDRLDRLHGRLRR